MALQEKGNFGISEELLEFFHNGKKTLEMFLGGVDAGRAPWKQHRGKVLDDWIKTRPGTRPFAWWEYDAPDHPTEFVPINFDDVKLIERHYIRWGVTHRPGSETFPEPAYQFESQSTYLKRKKLLVRGELARITPKDFEPKELYPFFKIDRFGKYSRIDDPKKVCSENVHGLANYDLVDVHYPDRVVIPLKNERI